MASSRVILVAAVACVLVLCLHGSTAQSNNNCPKFCTLEYAPICGTKADGTTMEFSNACGLNVHNCNNPGEIVSQVRGRCP
ncbi:vasotab [Ischnura elegans]|uniref:vasotab n=1 Tax=Ischnura elegans TaxID=197161 RepID=UPI001ED8AA35|nr:vasotab [Ischnura elegans]